MASSDEGERALAVVLGQGERAAVAPVSGQAEREAVAVSDQGGRATVAVSGDGEAAVSRKRKQCHYENILDYPCTERLRWRRLLAYLRENCYNQTYHVAKNELGVFFDVEDLVKRVKTGQLEEACHHLWTFAPIRHLSSKAEVLTLFLHYLTAIHRFADGNTANEGIVRDWFRKLYKYPALLSKYPCLATLVADVLSLRTVHVRNSLDWQLVRNKAAEMVEQIVSEVPELKEKTRFPRLQDELYDVMPIRCSFRPRRQVKKAGKKQARDLAKFYLETKKRLVPSAPQMDYHDYSAGSSSNRLGLVLIKLFEKVLQAGQRKVLKQGHPPESLSREVSTLKAAQVCKSIPGHMMIEKGHRPEHASNQAMKRPRFLESQQDNVHQGNALKRLHIAGNSVKVVEERQGPVLPVVKESQGPAFTDNELQFQMEHSFVKPPLTYYLDVMAVHNWRVRLASLINRLMRLLPLLGPVTTFRRSLQEIFRCCITTTILGTRRMVRMSLIQAELWKMKDTFRVIENLLLHVAMIKQPAILDILSLINGELKLLEQLCSCAMPLHEAPTPRLAALAYEKIPAAD